jgi:hypothetical protein
MKLPCYFKVINSSRGGKKLTVKIKWWYMPVMIFRILRRGIDVEIIEDEKLTNEGKD